MLGKRFLVTGGAGFIGSAFIRYGLRHYPACEKIVNLDLLTYAGNLRNLDEVAGDARYRFVQGNICNEEVVEKICIEHDIDAIVHFAAESHVDRSIEGPRAFLETNVGGTFSILEVMRRHPHLHLHHVSTDEVYGSLPDTGFFKEDSPYCPNSPYAASKAASDLFVKAFAHTYGLSVTLSHCSNNYGPYQFTEKFIPRMILSCLKKEPFPLYGNGCNVRDWLFVEDHAEALWMILEKGIAGQTYDIGGGCEKKNRDLLHDLIHAFALLHKEDPKLYYPLIQFTADRPGHDLRYAIDFQKINKEIGWSPRHSLDAGIKKTIAWYARF